MSHRRMPYGLMIIAPVVIGFGVYAFTGQRPVPPAPGASPTPQLTPYDYLSPTPYIVEPTPYSTAPTPVSPPFAADPSYVPPTKQRGDFREGAWVRVNAGAGDCLNARNTPSIESEYSVVNVCLPDGYEGYVAGDASEAEGHWWWMLAGAGYVAEEYLQFVRYVSVRDEALAPQYASAGEISFIRDGAIWIMNADGSGQHEIVPAIQLPNGGSSYPSELSWSPDGRLLSYNITRWSDDGSQPPTTELHIVDAAGNELAVYPRRAGHNWSPDSTQLGIVEGALADSMGGGWQGQAGWMDIATGEVHILDADAEQWRSDTPQFNYDGTLLQYGHDDDIANSDGTTTTQRSIIITDLDGAEVARIEQPQDEYYSSQRWSPAANRIAIRVSAYNPGDATSDDWYAVYDLDTGAMAGTATIPDRSEFVGGKCGGGDMWRPAWSADGSTLYFSYDMGVAGTNGVWAWDVAGGTMSLTAAAWAGLPSAGGANLVTFSGNGYILIAQAGGAATLVTEGSSPQWVPSAT